MTDNTETAELSENSLAGNIQIADTGVGMTPEVQARIFEPGEGSTFSITLPAVPGGDPSTSSGL